MHPSESKRKRIVELAEEAIHAAKLEKQHATDRRTEWLVIECDRAIGIFESIKERATTGTLKASGGAGLGITRALSEWDAPEALYQAGHNLEQYFKMEWQ